jgi:hypothetical protein
VLGHDAVEGEGIGHDWAPLRMLGLLLTCLLASLLMTPPSVLPSPEGQERDHRLTVR